MKFKIAFLTCLLFLSSLYGQSFTGYLIKISDGDTMTFNIDNTNLKCRIYGIDTPEKFRTKKLYKDTIKSGIDVEVMVSLGKAATEYAKSKLRLNQRYRVETYGLDVHNRSLCVIYMPEGTTYNEMIVKDGYAVVYKKGKYTKDKELRHTLNTAQGEAVKNKSGFWKNHKDIMRHLALF